MFNLRELWLGDAASLKEAMALEERALSASTDPTAQASMRADAQANAADAVPRLYSRNGNVGVITVRGPLINAENFLTAAFDISTYPAIRAALVYAAQDPNTTEILLDIESPGGAVSGVNDTAQLVKQVDGIKRVTAFSDSLIASAAYWIATGARKIHVGETAIVGSIGIIATSVNVSEQLKKDGVQVTIVRAGENKALGHPAEPVSQKAIAQLQERANALYDVFTTTASTNRPKLAASKVDTWANGNEFLGADAVTSGLADTVSTFDKVFSQLVENLDASKSPNNNATTRTRGMQMKPRAILDPKLIALIQSGATLNAEQQAELDAANVAAEALATAAAATESAVAAATAATEAAAAEAKKLADATAAEAVSAEAKAATAAAEAEKKANEKTESEIVAFLRASLKEKDQALLDVTIAKKALETKVADSASAHDALCTIARNSINVMTIALGGSELSLASLSATELVAKHAALAADFSKAFVPGGVASTATETVASEASNVTRIDAARVKAVGLSK